MLTLVSFLSLKTELMFDEISCGLLRLLWLQYLIAARGSTGGISVNSNVDAIMTNNDSNNMKWFLLNFTAHLIHRGDTHILNHSWMPMMMPVCVAVNPS